MSPHRSTASESAAEDGRVVDFQTGTTPPSAMSMGHLAYARLKDLIVSLQLPPGELLTERELCEAVDLPRSPVRDALRRLAEDDLVEVFPRRGILITPVDIRDLGAISEMRVPLETLAAGLAAARASEAERLTMRDLLSRLDAFDTRNSGPELVRIDGDIHRHIYRCTHNRFLEEALEKKYVLSLRLYYLVLDRMPNPKATIKEHRQLLTTIIDGDSTAAEQVIRDHILKFESGIRRLL